MPEKFGDKLTRILEEKKLKKADIVRLTGISSGLISEICNNKRDSMTIDTLQRIARALNITAGELLEGTATAPLEKFKNANNLSVEFKEFIEKYKSWIEMADDYTEDGFSAEDIRRIVENLKKIQLKKNP